MSHLRRLVLASCVTTALIAAGLAATGASGSVAPCVAARMTAKMTVIKSSFGAGHVSYRLTLKNLGPGECLAVNHPGLKLLSKSGRGLPTHVVKLGAGGFVTILAGHSASAQLRFSPDVPGPGEPQRGPCEPKAHKVRVILSQSERPVGAVTPPTSVCEHGSIQEQPLH